MTRRGALATVAVARVAGLSLGAYVAGLVAGVPVLMTGGTRSDHLAALIASSAELSTLSRNPHRLTNLLRQGSVRAAQEYRDMLDTVADDVRKHLTLAASVLADLPPRHGRTPAAPDQHAWHLKESTMSQQPNIDGILIQGATGSSTRATAP